MSTLKVNNIGKTSGSTQDTMEGLGKVWVNFNGTGTIATRDSHNVSGLTDHSTGRYTIAYSSNMNNANYANVVGQEFKDGGNYAHRMHNDPDTAQTTSNVKMMHRSEAAYADNEYLFTCVMGDLA